MTHSSHSGYDDTISILIICIIKYLNSIADDHRMSKFSKNIFERKITQFSNAANRQNFDVEYGFSFF